MKKMDSAAKSMSRLMVTMLVLVMSLFISFGAMAQDYVYQESTELSTESVEDFQSDPGFLMDLGIGYGGLLGVDVQFSIGGNFNRYFSLMLDMNFAIGLINEADAAVVPRFHLFYGCFRFSVGLGIGFIWRNEPGDYSPDYEYGFMIKPEVHTDWFVGSRKRWYVGLGVEWPIGLGMQKGGEDWKDDPHPIAIDQCAVDFHFGYKFGL